MGSGASNAIPEQLDIKTFTALSGDRFDGNFFYAFKDQATGTISKQKFLEFANKTDAYFSYYWGVDEEGERIQDRLSTMATWLLHRGLICHFDGDIQSYQCRHQNIQDEIDNAQVFISCVTQKYINRVKRIEESKPNKNSFEYNHAKRTKSYKKMIFLILDRSVLHLSSWSDLIGIDNLETINIHDFTVDENLDMKYEMLYQNVMNLVTPLRLVSFFSQASARAKRNLSKLKTCKVRRVCASARKSLHSNSFAITAATAAIADAFNEPPPKHGISTNNDDENDMENIIDDMTPSSICTIPDMILANLGDDTPSLIFLPDVYQDLRLQVMKISITQNQDPGKCNPIGIESDILPRKLDDDGFNKNSRLVLISDRKLNRLDTANNSMEKEKSRHSDKKKFSTSSSIQCLKSKKQLRSSTKQLDSF